MVCMRVAFHEIDVNHENDEDDEDSYKQRVECWISGNHGNHGNDENHGNSGCKTTGSPKQTGFRKHPIIVIVTNKCPLKSNFGMRKLWWSVVHDTKINQFKNRQIFLHFMF